MPKLIINGHLITKEQIPRTHFTDSFPDKMASTQLMPISPKDYRNLLGELEKLLPDSLTVSFSCAKF
jgi:hypothetical protein